MEQRLFVAACVMYLFSWISKRLFRNNKLDLGAKFGIWNSIFLLLILSCAYYIIHFIISNGNPISDINSGFSIKSLLVWVGIIGISICGFF